MARSAKRTPGKKKSVSHKTDSVKTGPAVIMPPVGGPVPRAAFIPVDFDARQEAIGQKRRTGGSIARAKAKAEAEGKPSDVPETKVE